MNSNEGSFTEFILPAGGTLRVQANWTSASDNIDIYMSYHGCPNLRAILNGGCVILAEDKSATKPAQISVEITAS